MRGADASAGTIKSGGATRRAAKMVVLDVDHPDIVEFIETKELEEEKIRVLRDAGYDMELGGRDINSVQYQNANNSVRVNAEFMNAVESGGKFGLRARTNGEVIEEVDASIESLKERSTRILESAQSAMQNARKEMTGSRVTAPPSGPMDTNMEQNSFTAEQIAAMSVTEYAKYRGKLLGKTASDRGKGIFG
jgi:hypothetical protein